MSAYEDPQQAIEAAGDALRSLHPFPWYDRTNDDLRRVDVPPPEHADASIVWNSPIFITVWITLAVVLSVLLVFLFRAMKLREARRRDRGRPLAGEVERIESLPFPVPRPNLSLIDQARSFYHAGNYAAAVLYLFSHQLVQLDRRQIIHLAKGKTNRQYLGEVAQKEPLRQLLGETLVAFEDVFFGHHDIDRQRFEACWSRLPEFETLLD